MIEFVFTKTDFCYQTSIDLGEDDAVIELDTGSPITTVPIPSLLQITGESLFTLRKKVQAFLDVHKPLTLGVYGSQMNAAKYEFLPYLVKDVKIDDVPIPYFLFWVDVTHINSKEIVPTSMLFGFDYLRQGKKWFDENDDFHISFDSITADLFEVDYAMSNINEEIRELKSLMA